MLGIREGAGFTIFPQIVLSHSAEKFRRGTLSASLISGIEKFYVSEGYVTTFCRVFLSHSAENLFKGTVLCCV